MTGARILTTATKKHTNLELYSLSYVNQFIGNYLSFMPMIGSDEHASKAKCLNSYLRSLKYQTLYMANTGKNKHLKKVLESVFPGNNEEEEWDKALGDAIEVAFYAANSLSLDPYTKKRLVNEAIWRATECKVYYKWKYGTRFRSREVVDEAKGLHDFDVRHEHVYTRKSLVKKILDEERKRTIRDIIMNEAIGCIVTKKQAEALNKVSKGYPQVEGWCRYCEAGIEVMDMKTEKPYEYDCSSCIPNK